MNLNNTHKATQSTIILAVSAIILALLGYARFSFSSRLTAAPLKAIPLPVKIMGVQSQTGYVIKREFIGRAEARRLE